MARCSAIKPDGTRCTLSAKGQLGLCWAHDPANRERRRKIASRGGRARSSKELRDIKADVRAVVAGVLTDELEKGRAAVAFNTLLRAVELEQKADLEDLARDVRELQRGYGQRSSA